MKTLRPTASWSAGALSKATTVALGGMVIVCSPPKQCDGPHKSCHRCRQSTCTGTVGLASSRHRLVRTFVYSVGLRLAFIVCLGARVANPIPGSVMLFGWFRSKGARDRSRLIKRIVSILKRGRDVF